MVISFSYLKRIEIKRILDAVFNMNANLRNIELW
jgi:hypothetical protein